MTELTADPIEISGPDWEPVRLTVLEPRQLAALFLLAERGHPACRAWTLRHFPQVLASDPDGGAGHGSDPAPRLTGPHPTLRERSTPPEGEPPP